MNFARIRLWFAYAARNLRSGLGGFWILLACLFLGVTAIAAVGSLSASIARGLADEGQPLLGGDVEFTLLQREATPAEFAYMESKGKVSRVATLRGMASGDGGNGQQSTLVEIKAVDGAYPLYGRLELEGAGGTRVSAQAVKTMEAFADPLLLGRLGLQPGGVLRIGSLTLKTAGVIATEPDRISDGFVLGPRLLINHETLVATGLVQPGSLVTWRYRVKLEGGGGLAEAKKIVAEAEQKFPDAGWRVRATDAAAAGAERFASRLAQFMTLVGLAALVVGGAGIGNSVAAFVRRREQAIATLKCLGLASADVVGLYLSEIILVGLLAIGAGCAVGAFAPLLLKAVAGPILPLPLSLTPAVQPLAFAALLGFLVLVAFSLLPLARISVIRGVSLFRGQMDDEPRAFSWRWVASAVLPLLVAAGLVVANSESQWVATQYLAGLAVSLLLLSMLAFGLLQAVRLAPWPSGIIARQALISLQRKHGGAFSAILALGLGLTLFVMLSLTDGTISRELRSGVPEKAPAFFFLDVPNDQLAAFEAALGKEQGVESVSHAPMLRGRISEVKGVAADKVQSKPGASWALRGDRGLTYSEALPKGSEIVRGRWWAAGYQGPALVSLAEDVAEGLGLGVGDHLKVNVLGREIEAEVASLRRVNWRSLGINFVMVFTPNTLKAAPHSHIVTVEMTGGDEAALLNRMAREFPSVTAVRVKEAIATVSDLLGKMLGAVRGANGLTLLTGMLVLAGALGASLAGRVRDAVILKTYGASRRQLMISLVLEYGFLGLVAAVFGLITGGVAAWYLATFILEMPWRFDPLTAVATALGSMMLVIATGLAVTGRALSVRPSTVLRNE